jgi:hypothetical protein
MPKSADEITAGVAQELEVDPDEARRRIRAVFATCAGRYVSSCKLVTDRG